MSKYILTRPTLIMLYGFPGAGKTFFARQLGEKIQAAHVQDNRIRYELFEQPRFDRQENEVIAHLMEYMTEEFLKAGVSVIYDTNAMRVSQRRRLRDVARRLKGNTLLAWLQIDIESAFSRVVKRDRRKSDDKYAMPLDRTTFEQVVGNMQNPVAAENYLVLSGKHTFHTQSQMIFKKMRELGLVHPDLTSDKVVKPGLVNLIPHPTAGRVDSSRRNIVIR